MKASELNQQIEKALPLMLTSKLSDVFLIYIFGSQASGLTNKNSDIDIAILCSKKIDPITRWDVQEYLASQFNKDVDLIDLLNTSTVMQHQIIYSGFCIYDPFSKQQTFEMQVMSMYQHLNFERADILEGYTD